jgi:hypothetical protein
MKRYVGNRRRFFEVLESWKYTVLRKSPYWHKSQKGDRLLPITLIEGSYSKLGNKGEQDSGAIKRFDLRPD